MIDRLPGGHIVFQCDSGGETFEAGTGDFNAAWQWARREGWQAKKIGDVWVHTCPGCK